MRYIANYRTYQINVDYKGRSMIVRFRDLGAYKGTSVFVTADKDLAKALESHVAYNKEFYLESGIPQDIEKPVAPEHHFDREFAHINKTQEAITILVQQYGCSRDQIKNMNDVVRKARELNISFPQIDKHITRYAKK